MDEIDRVVADSIANITAPGVVSLTRMMVDICSPPGAELGLARLVALWGETLFPDASWTVDEFDVGRANVMVETRLGVPRAECGFIGHLDTSLTGDVERDLPLTGLATPPPRFEYDQREGNLSGFGVGVAKAATAGGLIALLAAAGSLRRAAAPHRLSMLLAAGGTHRAAVPRAGNAAPALGFGAGVKRALTKGWRPSAVINVKGGAPGVLWEEPGALYVEVIVTARYSSMMQRSASWSTVVMDAIERWRQRFRKRPTLEPTQIEREAGIGAVSSGLHEKPDLQPGRLRLGVYVVTGLDDDSFEVAREIQSTVEHALEVARMSAQVQARPYAYMPAGRTAPDAPIVQLATAAWERIWGAGSAAVRGWKGSTDGALLRSAGIDTVRLGPRLFASPDDPRREAVQLENLLKVMSVWAEVAVRHCMAP